MKPLLAATIESTATLIYPCLVSPKLDGIRALVIDGVVMSRSLKPIRNKHVQALFGKAEYNGLDGELIVGDPRSKTCYRDTNSGVMSEDGTPDVKFHVFDRYDLGSLGFTSRYAQLPQDSDHIVRVPHHHVSTEEVLLELETKYLEEGYEGLMVRSVQGGYKQGRSTLRDGILGKLKRFSDAEYKIVGFEERMKNENVATVNALGHTERSTHKENLVGRGDLGALVLEFAPGQTFNCGTGFTDDDRAFIWAHRDQYLGRYAKIKSFLIGVKDLPRFPVWVGFRDESDMEKAA